MNFGNILEGLGLPGVVIFGLAAALIFVYKEKSNLQKQLNDLQDTRAAELRDTRDKILEPLQEQITLGRQIYDVLTNPRNKRGS